MRTRMKIIDFPAKVQNAAGVKVPGNPQTNCSTKTPSERKMLLQQTICEKKFKSFGAEKETG